LKAHPNFNVPSESRPCPSQAAFGRLKIDFTGCSCPNQCLFVAAPEKKSPQTSNKTVNIFYAGKDFSMSLHTLNKKWYDLFGCLTVSVLKVYTVG